MDLSSKIIPWTLVVLGVAALAISRRRHTRVLAEQRKAQEALTEANAALTRIRQAVHSASDAIGIGDFDGTSLYHNQAHVDLFGYSVEELNAVPGKGVLFADKQVAREILASVQRGRSWSGETEVLTKDGRCVPAYVRSDIIRDDRGSPVGIFGVFRDVSRERQMELEAARANRLDSLGIMAGGIAHDFNNLLSVMVGQVGLLQMDSELPEGAKHRLSEVERVIWRARDMTERLKSFAKGKPAEKMLIALPPAIRDAVDFAVQNSNVRLDCVLPADLRPVIADEAQMVQVLNNLAVNAVQAMENGGTLTVRATNIEPPEAAILALREGSWVRITVADTGVGIPPENLARIFEPFFTTKASGTGLGLATSYSIVAKHGGHLRVDSKPGRGTTFQILLPAAGEKIGNGEKAKNRETRFAA